MSVEFTNEEIELIKEIISDIGSDQPILDWDKVQNLKYKLGIEVPPTEEELVEQERKRKEFAESDFGKQIAEIMAISNNFLKKEVEKILKVNIFMLVPQWDKGEVGDLRIKLPNDYIVKNDKL